MPRWILFVCLVVAAPFVRAQPDTAPRIPAAETSFGSGLSSYRSAEYVEALRLFSRVAEDFGYNARTTAALLMAGKSAYADGNFDQALSTLTTFIRLYPRSRYVHEAQDVIRMVTQGGPAGPDVFELGVILPATGESGYLAQALFNGVRLAVDAYNARAPGRPVRLVFRDTEGSEAGASVAMNLVVREGVEAVIGPLFSQEAISAAGVAEREGIVLIAPLATEEGVSSGRRFVFQANPTFLMRGRVMARYAVEGLQLGRLGVVAETGSYGEVMADGFQEEAGRLGALVPLSQRIAAEDWQRLPSVVGIAAMSRIDAVYFPVTGADGGEHAAQALRGMEAMGLEGVVGALGNTEWETLDASRGRASRLGTYFTLDFFIDDEASIDFVARYRELAGIQADRLALIGYDTAQFVLNQINNGAEDSLADKIRNAPRHRGLAHKIEFAGGQINQALFIMAYRNGEAVLVE